MRTKIQAVLFDFDEVLWNNGMEVWETWMKIFTKNGLKEIPYDEFSLRTGNTWGYYRDRGLHWSNDEIEKFFNTTIRESHCSLMDGARYTLEEMRRRKIRCAIVSAHPAAPLREKILRLGIVRYFDHVIPGTRDKTGAIRLVCKKLSVQKKRVIYIDDRLSDVLHGREAGVKTVLFAPKDSPHKHHADYHITHLSQIFKILDLL